jgi:phosphoribosyl 1,2-cyclic phosphate phosphodiesterase
MMKLRFLGTGWSHGVPAIGCDCAVCTGNHPRNRRRRASVQLMDGDVSVVVDVGPDFRDQALTFGINTLDAVFITHQHADHVMGLDDVRRFSWLRGDALPVWAERSVLKRLEELYPYATPQLHAGKGVPLIDFSIWTATVKVGGMNFTPFAVPHGAIPCFGVRIDGPGGSIGYVPDCSGLPAAALGVLQGVDVMILNALRITPHPSHLSLAQSLGYLEKVGAPQSYITHMGCPLDYVRENPDLPEGIEMAWDGLVIQI